jgi:protein TonB
MKRIALLFALFFSSISVFGQVEVPDSSSRVYKYRVDIIDEEPQFQGGDLTDFSKWVDSKVEYVDPEICCNGRVVLQFVVKADGSVADIKVLRSLDPTFDKEAIRVVSSSPKWKPGKLRGEAVNVSMTLPVTFMLR